MANCRNCGKPLVVNGGKCAYCGASVQGTGSGSGPKTPAKTPWFMKLFTAKKSGSATWMEKLIRRSAISTIVALVLGVILLIADPWPGCLISIAMLLFAIITGAFGIIIQSEDIDEYIGDMGETKASSMLNHILNMVLIWGYFFFVVGVVCLFISWWAVLLAELVGVGGMLLMFTIGRQSLDSFY